MRPTNDDELNELKERITRLGLGDQLHLFAMVFADYRRRWDEDVARQEIAAREAWHAGLKQSA